jgi:hypothetical protein
MLSGTAVTVEDDQPLLITNCCLVFTPAAYRSRLQHLMQRCRASLEVLAPSPLTLFDKLRQPWRTQPFPLRDRFSKLADTSSEQVDSRHSVSPWLTGGAAPRLILLYNDSFVLLKLARKHDLALAGHGLAETRKSLEGLK